MNDKPNLIMRVLLAIPVVRHKLFKQKMLKENKERELFSFCNRAIAYKVAPNIAQLVAEGKLTINIFENIKYFRYILTQMYGNKVREYASQLKIERVKLKNPIAEIRLLITPSSGEIGQTAMIAFVYGENLNPKAYILEHSFNKQFVVCEWNNDKHFNYGIVPAKKDFIYKLLELSKEEINNKQDYSSIDLKHRLANEIGVRVERLDLYMNLFQKKLIDEMNGIDSSGIPEEVDDEEEWMRYMMWEVNQSKSRMSEHDLQDANSLFEMMIERDKRKANGNDGWCPN